MTPYPTHWPEFYTAKIHQNKHLLKKVAYKNIILSSLEYLVSNKKIKLFAYVIMDNHIHLIWQTLPGNNPDKIRYSFMKFTAQQIKFELEKK
jgi:REP element-mobilizing transposase RayT